MVLIVTEYLYFPDRCIDRPITLSFQQFLFRVNAFLSFLAMLRVDARLRDITEYLRDPTKVRAFAPLH